jgi:hypothetical protein
MKSFYEFYLHIQREAATTTTSYSSSIVTGNPTNNPDMQRKLDIMKRMEDPNWDPNKEAQRKAPAAQAQRQAPTTPTAPAKTAPTGMDVQKTLSAKTDQEFWNALGPKMQKSIVDYTKSGRSQEIEKKWTDNYKNYPNAVVVLKRMFASVARKYAPNNATNANNASSQQKAQQQAAPQQQAVPQQATPTNQRNSFLNRAANMIGLGRKK